MTEHAKHFFKVKSLMNRVTLNAEADIASISQSVQIESERVATLFISQLLDDIEMFEPIRYPVEKGLNMIELKNMRVIHPRLRNEDGESVCYKIGVAVLAAGVEMISLSEMRHLGTSDF